MKVVHLELEIEPSPKGFNLVGRLTDHLGAYQVKDSQACTQGVDHRSLAISGSASAILNLDDYRR
jgi:hypothetical protein